jgi:ERCC4-type nuclease
MKLIVDTREQKPLFENELKQGLLVGDYTTSRLFNKYHIERKSLSDLYGTMTKGNVRFHNCIIRANANGIRLVMVVEGSKRNFRAKKFPQGNLRKISGETLIKIVETFERKYLLVYWCANRRAAKILILKLLREEEVKVLRKEKSTLQTTRLKQR